MSEISLPEKKKIESCLLSTDYILIKNLPFLKILWSISGSEIVDQILTVLLSTSMFVGGLVGFILDNTIPGM